MRMPNEFNLSQSPTDFFQFSTLLKKSLARPNHSSRKFEMFKTSVADPDPDPDPVGSVYYWLSWIQLDPYGILLALLDPDPYLYYSTYRTDLDPDPAALKLIII